MARGVPAQRKRAGAPMEAHSPLPVSDELLSDGVGWLMLLPLGVSPPMIVGSEDTATGPRLRAHSN